MSSSTECEVIAVSGNYAVVKLRERQFPGVMMQGDTFHCLIREIAEAEEFSGGSKKAREILRELLRKLLSVQELYEQTLKDMGMRRPYET